MLTNHEKHNKLKEFKDEKGKFCKIIGIKNVWGWSRSKHEGRVKFSKSLYRTAGKDI